ncbi:hypothetical protein BDZ45DRAFT_747522 [Acephala macrosclerotiorum]|nr:hypothetical protein BDZ45DRAFT_747522 [Acephala macrosclerotiorum]
MRESVRDAAGWAEVSRHVACYRLLGLAICAGISQGVLPGGHTVSSSLPYGGKVSPAQPRMQDERWKLFEGRQNIVHLRELFLFAALYPPQQPSLASEGEDTPKEDASHITHKSQITINRCIPYLQSTRKRAESDFSVTVTVTAVATHCPGTNPGAQFPLSSGSQDLPPRFLGLSAVFALCSLFVWKPVCSLVIGRLPVLKALPPLYELITPQAHQASIAPTRVHYQINSNPPTIFLLDTTTKTTTPLLRALGTVRRLHASLDVR